MKYAYSDIVDSLKKSGINNGDTVFFTTGLGMVGIPPAGVDTQEKLNKLFLEAIKETLGEKGTIFVPTYSYTFGRSTATNPAVFNPETTRSQIGSFPNFFLKQPGVVRSLDPMMSIAGLGPRAEEFLAGIPPISYGEGSTFSRLVKSDAKCCSIGLGPNWIPFIHYAEWRYRVPFRYDKFFYGVMNVDKITKFTSWIYTVRILAKESIANAHRVGRLAEEVGMWQCSLLGRARVYTTNCNKYFEFICDCLKKDKWSLATGPARDPFILEEKRVGVVDCKVWLRSFDVVSWFRVFSDLRRDIASEGIDAVFNAIAKYFPLSFSYWPSGSRFLGWITPEKWICRNFCIATLKDEIVFSFDRYPNFVRSYSLSIDKQVSRKELLRHINIKHHLAPFNYRDWGFCLPDSVMGRLTQDYYKVSIQSDFYYGKMRTAELVLRGSSNKVIVIASYIDGPYKVNSSLSGSLVSLLLYQRMKNKDRNLNYSFLLLPGEVGFALWLSNYATKLRKTIGIIHLKWLGLLFRPMLFGFGDNKNPIRKAAELTIGEDSVKIKPSLFRAFCGSDNPLKQGMNMGVSQYLFCRTQLSRNSGAFFWRYQDANDVKIVPQGIEDSVDILQNIINRIDDESSVR